MLSRVTILFLLLASTVSFAADPEPYLKSASMPFYPPLCRSARISGIVTLHFTVNENGDTSYVEAVSGHQLLRDAAIQNVQSWKFAWPHPCDCHVKREVVFVYSIGDWLDDDGPNSIVKWFGKGPVQRVEVQAGSISVQP
jgi:TonB family protein